MMITWNFIETICAGVTLLGGAWVIISRTVNKLKAPIAEIHEKMEEMKQTDKQSMARIEAHEARLNTHKEMIDKIILDNKESMHALLLILKHAETGNCTGEIAEGRERLEDYLNNSRY